MFGGAASSRALLDGQSRMVFSRQSADLLTENDSSESESGESSSAEHFDERYSETRTEAEETSGIETDGRTPRHRTRLYRSTRKYLLRSQEVVTLL